MVVVSHEPGSWFDQTLTSLAGQDYPRYAVTVVTSDDSGETADRVESAMPAATVIVAPDGGYAAAANEVLDDEQTPAFYLFCHDDVALSSDALRLMVEESIRSNASVVGPKVVDWDNPEVLVEVGFDVDKLGHAASRIEVGELDQEQHDGVIDVFAVSGACQLVRSDLFRALDGFDDQMGVTGEDIDFCWRSHIAGARVMIVPSAVVRHRRGLADRRGAIEVERLTERHRVRTLLSVYGPTHSLRVLPQALVYMVIRAVGAAVAGQFRLARDTVGAWGWNLRRAGSLLRRRGAIRRSRKVRDGEIRALHVRGFAPVSGYLRGQFGDDGRGTLGARMRSLLRSLRSGPSRISLGFWAITAVVLAFGSRHAVTRGVPVVGDLVPFDLSPGELFGRYFDSWVTTGTGHEAAAPTAFGLTGVFGTLFLGAMGLLRTVMTVGMIPIGAIGMWRFLRPFASPWIRVVGTLMYVVSPVPYNALANGSWGALLLFGLTPWLLAMLGRGAMVAPFGRLGGAVGEGVLAPALLREVMALGLLTAVLVAYVPFAAAVLVAMAIAVSLGSLLAGWPGGTARLTAVTAGALAVAAALNLPWIVHNVINTPGWEWFGGSRPSTPATPDLATIMRFDSGPIGGGVVGWALPVAGITPLLLARGPRWAWAVRGSSMYLLSVGSVWALGNGWMPLPLPRPEVLYSLGAVGLAVSAAMGVAAIERDLRTYRFGWRQLAPVTAVVAVVVALLPPTAASFNGAWNMPDQEFNELFEQQPPSPGTRVLWIGHDDVLSVGGAEFRDGLTVAVSSGRVVGFADRWAGSPQPADELLQDALLLAVDGGTSRLGRLLAPFAIGEIIVVAESAPAPATRIEEPVPDTLIASLEEQLDLAQVEVSPGLVRYRNDAALGLATLVPAGTTSETDLRSFGGSRSALDATILEPADGDHDRFVGQVAVGQEVYVAAPVDTQWVVEVDGRTATRTSALGWASAFDPPLSGTVEARHVTETSHRLLMAGQGALWLLAIVSLMRLNARAREVQP